jgi:general secretion pathway protein C
MSERLVALLVWILVGWSAGFFALRLWPQPLQQPAALPPAGAQAPLVLDRLLGSGVPAAVALAPQDGRYRLLGLVAPKGADLQGEQGVALIAVDGAPPRALRLGQAVDAELQLLKVEAHGVSLGREGQVRVQLRLDPPAAATQGQLPPVSGLVVEPPPAPQAQPPALAERGDMPRRRNPAAQAQ